jgi:RNA polymerase sigma-70 factor (ECF subfamily)
MDTRRRFGELVRPILADLYRFARRLTRDPVTAEDLLQQALLRGMDRLPQLQDERAFKVWQSRVLYTTFLDARDRRETMWIEGQDDDVVVPLERPGPDRDHERRELGTAIRDALDRLPADQRDAVWLVDGQGLKFGEAAGVLGVPPGTVASRVARGRMALREELKQIAADEGVGR